MSARRAGAALVLGLAVAFSGPAAAGDAPSDPDAVPWEVLLHRGRLGMEVQTLTPELRRHLGAPEDRGVLVARVEPDRPAGKAGIEVGDVVVSAAGAPVRSSTDLLRAVAPIREGGTLELELVRNGEIRLLRVAPDGPPLPDAEELGDWLEKGMREGSEQLRRQLEELQRRLEEFERQLRQPPPGSPRPT